MAEIPTKILDPAFSDSSLGHISKGVCDRKVPLARGFVVIIILKFMKKQFTILLILFFAFGLLKALPASAIIASGECNYSKGGIMSILPATAVSAGQTIVINGSGFGELFKACIWGSDAVRNSGGKICDSWIYNKYVDISLLKNGEIYGTDSVQKNAGIISWTDTKIELSIPNTLELSLSGKKDQLGVIDLAKDALVFSIHVADLTPVGNSISGPDKAYQYYIYGSADYYICANPLSSGSFLYNPSCNADIWGCSDWNSCSLEGQQTRNCSRTLNCPFANTPSPITTQSCDYVPPACTSWTYSNWNTCSVSGQQTRTIISSFPVGCVGGNPTLTQSCTYAPPCNATNWDCTDWSSCSILYGKQTRQCSKKLNCEGGVAEPATSQSCTYVPTCSFYSWSCGSWSSCSSNSTQIRSCSKISSCEGGTQSPATTQSCTYTPACSQDTWECGNWGTCSPQGTQSRSCNRTYDCPSAETAAPATSQYCEAPNQPKLQSPTEDLGIVNQDSIIRSTVKLICPVSSTMASQGSGTVIDSKGTILTNKHVIDGTPGCLVGFIDSYGDEPYFGDRQIADIYKVSGNSDVAVLKLRNPSNKSLASVNISQGNSSSIKLGEILTTYGYPAKFGTKITYTSGDFSGVDGDYLKTTAVIEHGNSGGGAYLKNGAFIGIPTAVIKGSLNSMGYLLSVNTVNSWLNNSIAYNSNSNNNDYSRVSAMLDNMDLNALGSLGLFVAGDEKNVKTGAENQIDKNLSNRLKGKILLQVENHGEAYYVNPKDNKKYYMADGNKAYGIMRNLGVGITNKNLEKIKANKIFAKSNSGKIFLQVESHGEAFYIDFNGKVNYLKDGSAAYNIMRNLGLGIKNSDLNKIAEGSL